MIEKKTFSLFDPKEEEAYLNQQAQKGYILEKVSVEGHHFKKGNPHDSYYLVEFFSDPNQAQELDSYFSQGFKLVCHYYSEKGAWVYLVAPNEDIHEPVLRNLSGRDELLKAAIKRVEVFSMTIAASLLILAIFMYLKQNNPLYILLIIMGVGLLSYTLFTYFKLKSHLK